MDSEKTNRYQITQIYAYVKDDLIMKITSFCAAYLTISRQFLKHKLIKKSNIYYAFYSYKLQSLKPTNIN